MNITIVTSALNDEEGKVLLELMGMPFKKWFISRIAF
jgi:ribosomal protein L5